MPPKGSGLLAAAGQPGVLAPPLPRAKGKAKGKGKGKGKSKAKAKAKARKLAALAAAQAAAAVAAAAANGEAGAEVIEGAPAADGAEVTALAIPAPKAKANPLKKKAQLMLVGKEVDEVISDARTKLQQSTAELAEQEALEKAQLEQAEGAKKEYEEATVASQKAMDDEMAAAANYKELNEKKQTVLATIGAKKTEMLDLQRKVAQMEVMFVNVQRMQELKDRQVAAAAAAAQAKKDLLDQRQKEKEALEATRRALAEMKGGKGGKAAGRGVKRPAEEITKPVHPDEADTLAATQPDAAASQDID